MEKERPGAALMTCGMSQRPCAWSILNIRGFLRWRGESVCPGGNGLGSGLADEGAVRIADHLDLHRGKPCPQKTQALCGAHADIEHTVANARPAVVYLQNQRSVIQQIGNLDPGSQREMPMGASHGFHVERVSAGGRKTLAFRSIPACHAILTSCSHRRG